MFVVKNFAISELATGVNNTVGTWVLKTGDGAKFPASGNYHVACETEIALCTARSGDTLTVTRGVDNTVAAAHTAGKLVGLVVSAGTIEELQAHLPLTGSVHGVVAVGSVVVGTNDAQTITNKRNQPRILVTTSYPASPYYFTPDISLYDYYIITVAGGGTFNFQAPIGSPVNGESITFRIKNTSSGGTPPAITMSWLSSAYRAIVATSIPTTLAGSATSGNISVAHYGFKYNSTDTKWEYIAVASRTNFAP